MKVYLGKWGNSLAVRIPAPVADGLHLQQGTEMELAEQNGAIVLTVTESHLRYPLAQLVDAMTEQNRHQPTDWGDAMGVEEW